MTWIFFGWMISRLFVLGMDPVSSDPTSGGWTGDGTVVRTPQVMDGTGGQPPKMMDGTGGQPPKMMDGTGGQPPKMMDGTGGQPPSLF